LEGYITLALDHPRYLAMAVNLARSLAYFDPKRPRCLVYNDGVTITPDVRHVFHDLVRIDARPGYLGCMNKIRLYDLTPYDRTMYIDADCLLVKGDIDRHWVALANSEFVMTGEKRTSGSWNRLDFRAVCEELKIPYVVQMNSGVFAFSRGERARLFFERLQTLYRDHRDLLSNIHQSRKGQYADEPFFGAAMGEFGFSPTGGRAEDGSWMVTTWNAKNCRFDPFRGESRIDKPSRYWFGVRHFPREWVVHSPTIAHFIGLKPKSVYARAASFFIDAAQL